MKIPKSSAPVLHSLSPFHIRFLCVLLFVGISFQSKSQYSTEGLSLQEETDSWFLDQIGLQQVGIIEGSYFRVQSKAGRTHPFLVNNQWLTGSVMFRGELFEGVDLRYQIEEDVLLTHDLSEFRKYNQHILLNRDQVDWFTIDGRHFRKYSPEIIGQPQGFFEEIHRGTRLTLIVKHNASLEVVASKAAYLKTKTHILMTPNGDHMVKRRSGWLRVLKPYKKALKSYMIANRIRKLDDSDNETLAQLTAYSENLMEEAL